MSCCQNRAICSAVITLVMVESKVVWWQSSNLAVDKLLHERRGVGGQLVLAVIGGG